MKSLMTPSRISAIAIVIAATLWVFSGQIFGSSHDGDTASAQEASTPAATPLQRVGVVSVTPEPHRRTVLLSCVTEADRRASAVARGAGVIMELSANRGDHVKADDVIAVISDEGRTAALAQAQASLDQVMIDYEARKRLIDRGDAPRNTLAVLDAQLAGARAQLAQAEAELDRTKVKAPIDGIIDTVPLQMGQAVSVGSEIAVIIDPDPMLAVGQVSEARRGLLQVGQEADVRFIDGSRTTGTIDFVGLSADKATRTYPVEARMDNGDAGIGDGVTCEMSVRLDPVDAVAVPRSALIFSDAGELGVRVVEDDKAAFTRISIVEDGRELVWVSGIDQPTSVIVVGQDFVRDGDTVISAPASDAMGGPSSNEVPPA